MKGFIFLVSVVSVFFSSNFSLFGQTQNEDEEEIIEVEQHSEDFYIDLSIEDMLVEVSDSQGNFLDVGEILLHQKEEIPFYLVMDKSAVFEGGNKGFYEIFESKIHFTKKMKEGRVFIEFTVDTTGKMIDLKVVKSISKENDKEALQVMSWINENYDWTPAMENDRKIRVRTIIGVIFKK